MPLGDPGRWAGEAARKIEGGRLISFAAKQRRVPATQGWGEMSDSEKAEFTMSQRPEDRFVHASRMKTDGSFQRASEKFKAAMMKQLNDRVMATDFDPAKDHYMKEINDIIDALPNEITAPLKIQREVEQDRDAMREKISKEASEVMSLFSGPNLEKQVAKELGIDVSDLTEDQVNNFLANFNPSDIAAGKLHVAGMKPGDITGVAKEAKKSLPFRLGVHDLSSTHIQRLVENESTETVSDVLNGGGGINNILSNATDVNAVKADLKAWAKKLPGRHKFLKWSITNPTGQAMNFAWARHAEALKDLDFLEDLSLDTSSPTASLNELIKEKEEITKRIEELKQQLQDIAALTLRAGQEADTDTIDKNNETLDSLRQAQEGQLKLLADVDRELKNLEREELKKKKPDTDRLDPQPESDIIDPFAPDAEEEYDPKKGKPPPL